LFLGLIGATPAAAEGQSPNSCVMILGLGSVMADTCSFAGGAQMITLQGSLDIATQNLPNFALVSCWVCEGGNCNGQSVYGPSVVGFDLPTNQNRSMLNWTVPFGFSNDAINGTSAIGASLPLFGSYYCRLELQALPRGFDAGVVGPPTVPDPLANYVHARTQGGSQLVVVLQGAL